MRRTIWQVAIFAAGAALLGGCGASLDNVTTGSLFGANTPPPPPANDPTSRAMQVGSTAARAIKCGYNFDPQRLRTQFLAAETAAAADSAGRIAQIYDTAFNGVSKAVAAVGETYCTAAKTRTIKEALTRHLAGDYSPSPPEPESPDDGGLFGGLGSSGPAKDPSMKHPVDELH